MKDRIRDVEVRPFLIDRCAVSNYDFAGFVADTSYVTEAGKFGWSYVFVGFLPGRLRRISALAGGDAVVGRRHGAYLAGAGGARQRHR